MHQLYFEIIFHLLKNWILVITYHKHFYLLNTCILNIPLNSANGLDRRHPNVASCLQPQLIKLAKEGTPSQAKQAVQVIHGVYQDSPKVLERLLEVR